MNKVQAGRFKNKRVSVKVVYVVRPVGGLWQTNKNEFIADWAEITSIVSKNDY